MKYEPESDLLADLGSRLDRKSIPHERLADGLRVASASDSGFDVSIQSSEYGWYVALGGWHEEVDDYEDARDYFVLGLSTNCRLAVTRRGFDHKWTLQRSDGGVWRDDSTTGLLLYPYFLPARTRYLQNEWWDPAV